MDAHTLCKRQRGAVLGDESKRAEGALEPRGVRGKDNVSDTWEPSCTAAYGWAIECKDEDFAVVDHRAEEFGCWKLLAESAFHGLYEKEERGRQCDYSNMFSVLMSDHLADRSADTSVSNNEKAASLTITKSLQES